MCKNDVIFMCADYYFLLYKKITQPLIANMALLYTHNCTWPTNPEISPPLNPQGPGYKCSPLLAHSSVPWLLGLTTVLLPTGLQENTDFSSLTIFNF